MFAKQSIGYFILALLTVGLSSSNLYGQMFKVYWKNLQLTDSNGVPNGSKHSYQLSGTFLVSDVPTESWNDSIPLLNSGGNSFTAIREQVFMEVRAEWRAETNEAVELITLTYNDGVQGKLESRFKSSVDPFLSGGKCTVVSSHISCDLPNDQVPVGNGLTEEKYPFFDLTGIVRGSQRPLSGGRINAQLAAKLSANGSSTTPTPSAPAPTSLRVTGDWLSSLGQINLEQAGANVLGTCVNKQQEVFLVKGQIRNNQLQLTLSISGVSQWSIEGLKFDSNNSTFRGRIRKTGKGASALVSSFTMTRKLKVVIMSPTDSGMAGTQGDSSNEQGGAGSGNQQPSGSGLASTSSVAGKWNSNLGSVTLTQTGQSVQGELQFANGVIANLSGTITKRNLNFQWGIAGQKLGSGYLKYQQDNRTLSGNYVDNRSGTPQVFTLTRK